MATIFPLMAAFIEENAPKLTNKLAIAKLLSWVPVLRTLNGTNTAPGYGVYYNATDIKQYMRAEHSVPQQFNVLAAMFSEATSFAHIRVPHITRNEWNNFHGLLNSCRDASRIQACLLIPASYPDCADWEMRETRKFSNGTYDMVPWTADLPPIPGHYVHFSKKSDDGLVAYTQSADKGARDLQTPIKPGKYLKQFYPDLTLDQIRDFVAICDKSNELQFATTGEQIEHVYLNGPTSCMVYGLDYFKGKPPVHPVQAYAGGDLALAYLRERSGKIVARGLVWPDKKLMGRLYGDIQRLQAALRKAGYTNESNDGRSLAGARMKMIKYTGKDKRDYIVMPYLDGDNMRTLSFCEDNEHFIIGAKGGTPYSIGNTEGCLKLPAFRMCPLSNKNYDLDNTVFVTLEDTKQEVARDACVNSALIFQCQKSQKYYSMATDNARVAVSWDRNSNKMTYEVWLADEVAKMAYTCAKTGLVISKQYLPPVILPDGSRVSPSWFATEGSVKKAA